MLEVSPAGASGASTAVTMQMATRFRFHAVDLDLEAMI